jgi:hypothetical protein
MPVYGGAPADQQPMDLRGAFAMVDSIIWRDGGIDQNEQREVMAWIQNFVLQAQAAAQQAAQMGGGDPNQQAGLGSSGSSIPNRPMNYNPMSGQGGVDLPGQGGDDDYS